MTIQQPSVGIIGAGFSGMTAAIQLQRKFGIQARIFEWSSDIGGTWLANTYPGCACDIPSGLYSFSFEQNPDWSTTYSSQPEILAYQRKVARKYHLYDQAYFNTEVIQITWNDSLKKWKVEYRTGEDPKIKSEEFDILFGGVGPLRIISIPDEYRDFKGTVVHTGAWDSTIDFQDKRVAVIGNGASAVQVLPELQKKVKHLYSYQRTPTWIANRYQLKYYRGVQILFRWFPFLMRLQRFLLYVIHESTFPIFKNSSSYLAKLAKWLFTRDMTKRLEKKGRADLVPSLVPNYALGCKRIARSELFLEALCEDNVTVKMGHITNVDGNTITHEDGSSTEVDILVLATGFNVQGFLGDLKVNGRNGKVLNDIWSGNNYPETYKTLTVHDFPNFFLLLGPNSGLGHNSVIIMIECQVDYALNCIKYMIRNKVQAVEPKKDRQSQFVAKVRKGLEGTTWSSGGCGSYYKKDGNVFAIWSGSVASYWLDLKFNPNDFNQYYLS